MVRNYTDVGNHIGAEEPGREGAKIYMEGRQEGGGGERREIKETVRKLGKRLDRSKVGTERREMGEQLKGAGRRKQEN